VTIQTPLARSCSRTWKTRVTFQHHTMSLRSYMFSYLCRTCAICGSCCPLVAWAKGTLTPGLRRCTAHVAHNLYFKTETIQHILTSRTSFSSHLKLSESPCDVSTYYSPRAQVQLALHRFQPCHALRPIHVACSSGRTKHCSFWSSCCDRESFHPPRTHRITI
jgi:hypothetical protein